jgi:hypothetical protein
MVTTKTFFESCIGDQVPKGFLIFLSHSRLILYLKIGNNLFLQHPVNLGYINYIPLAAVEKIAESDERLEYKTGVPTITWRRAIPHLTHTIRRADRRHYSVGYRTSDGLVRFQATYRLRSEFSSWFRFN